jgi:hypothetical protein
LAFYQTVLDGNCWIAADALVGVRSAYPQHLRGRPAVLLVVQRGHDTADIVTEISRASTSSCGW